MKSQLAMSGATTLLLSRSAIPPVLFESARTHSQHLAASGLNPRNASNRSSPPDPRSGNSICTLAQLERMGATALSTIRS